jgi:tryptophan synthase alpha chain
MTVNRITRRLDTLAAENRAGLITFVTGGDPDFETSSRLLAGLPGAGADLVEIGIPFSDPMADGPAIQASNLRALGAGATVRRTLDLTRAFRRTDKTTPIVLMGYFNPIYRYGIESFVADAVDAGVDGLIVVDLPPEEDEELRLPAKRAGLEIIRLAAPTTDDARLPVVLANAGGFLYYVSITGITGTATARADAVDAAVKRLKRATGLPIAVGFGIRAPEQVTETARIADAVVVGSAIVQQIAANLDRDGYAKAGLVEAVLGFVRSLGNAARHARGATRRAAKGSGA